MTETNSTTKNTGKKPANSSNPTMQQKVIAPSNTAEFTAPSLLDLGEQYTLARDVFRNRYIIIDRLFDGGEAQLFKASSTSNNASVVVKVYNPSKENVAHHEVVKLLYEKWSKADFEDHNLMPILDYGVINDKNGHMLWVEVHPYIDGHFPVKWSYNDLKSVVIPQLLHAIKSLHDLSVLHLDIKPANLFIYVDKILLGDYGAACIKETTSNQYTRTLRGTPGYTDFDNPFSKNEKKDYYSLGMTIATLFQGEHVYQDILDRNEGDGEIIDRVKNEALPLKQLKGFEHISKLVNSLTNPEETRADYNDVKAWLKNPASFEEKPRGSKGGLKGSFVYTATNNDYLEARNLKDIASFFISHWEETKRFFYSDYGQKAILNSIIDEGKKARLATNAELYHAGNRDCGFALALNIMNPESPLCWKGTKYDNLNAIANSDDLSILSEMIGSNYLSEVLEEKRKLPGSNYKEENIEFIKQIEDTFSCKYSTRVDERETAKAISVMMFRYAFSGKKGICEYNKCSNIDEWYSKKLNDSKCFISIENELSLLMNDSAFWAFASVGGKQKPKIIEVTGVRNTLLGKVIDWDNAVYAFYSIGEKSIENPAVLNRLRTHYVEYGPLSIYYWLNSNLRNYYKCADSEVPPAIVINKTAAIMESRNVLEKLGTEYRELFKSTTYNPLLENERSSEDNTSVIPLRKDSAIIPTLHYGNVPIAYLEYMKGRINYSKEVLSKRVVDEARTIIDNSIGRKREAMPCNNYSAASVIWAIVFGLFFIAILAVVVLSSRIPLIHFLTDTSNNGFDAPIKYMINKWPIIVGLLAYSLFPLSEFLHYFSDFKKWQSISALAKPLQNEINRLSNRRNQLDVAVKKMIEDFSRNRWDNYHSKDSSSSQLSGSRTEKQIHKVVRSTDFSGFVEFSSFVGNIALNLFLCALIAVCLFCILKGLGESGIILPTAVVVVQIVSAAFGYYRIIANDQYPPVCCSFVMAASTALGFVGCVGFSWAAFTADVNNRIGASILVFILTVAAIIGLGRLFLIILEDVLDLY